MKLAIDSSQSSGSIAIIDKDRLLYSAFFDIRITHSETLMPALDSAMSMCGFQPKDIEELYVCLGPGSFTGLRIGLATCKGIAFAGDIPVFGYSSLEMAALPCVIAGKPILSVIDAKMQEVYVAGFNAELKPTISARVISPKSVADLDIEGYIITGSGVPQVSGILQEAGIRVCYAPPYLHQLKAEMLFELPRYISPNVYQGKDLANLEPLYIRESTAQIRASTPKPQTPKP